MQKLKELCLASLFSISLFPSLLFAKDCIRSSLANTLICVGDTVYVEGSDIIELEGKVSSLSNATGKAIVIDNDGRGDFINFENLLLSNVCVDDLCPGMKVIELEKKYEKKAIKAINAYNGTVLLEDNRIYGHKKLFRTHTCISDYCPGRKIYSEYSLPYHLDQTSIILGVNRFKNEIIVYSKSGAVENSKIEKYFLADGCLSDLCVGKFVFVPDAIRDTNFKVFGINPISHKLIGSDQFSTSYHNPINVKVISAQDAIALESY